MEIKEGIDLAERVDVRWEIYDEIYRKIFDSELEKARSKREIDLIQKKIFFSLNFLSNQ